MFQRQNRRTAEAFAKHQHVVHEYRRKKGIEGDIYLQFDPKWPTKVDEWKEYYYSQHRKLSGMRITAGEGRRWREEEKKRSEEGSGGSIRPADLYHFRTIPESKRRNFMILLNWIEQQLPEIAQECAMSNKESPRPDPVAPVEVFEIASPDTVVASMTENTTKSIRRSNNRNKQSTNPVLGSFGAPQVTKVHRKTPPVQNPRFSTIR
ncbi:hypothetical protein AJ78_07138 [Emergomyces pasteurianus Ep9510]|uniref:Uncharacterized protein n=1 Tax=Emergomyces pasteurianus Ep9510 TaxID=1447872 RepID=A0A1J9P708_9EURO|nr:hypothetical protein AJ78_07138 [Emergomyces pasteurianus Ep9510]